ncbi:unnamed protein product [Allacma fusca]|uniref:DDB1- and CUL4-associated factor 8 n=1 Tax=Allacma fusca TaxID=39272 RepID=A0A8J2LMJ5_9HEXA|nr:unnamed protein product [Allacma fusca]
MSDTKDSVSSEPDHEIGKGNSAMARDDSLAEADSSQSLAEVDSSQSMAEVDSGQSLAATPSTSSSGEEKSFVDCREDLPATVSSSGIKKRSSSSQQRNYRSSQEHLSGGGLDSDDSDDDASPGSSESSKSSKKRRADRQEQDNNSNMEASSNPRASNSEEGIFSNEESNDSNDWSMAIGHGSPNSEDERRRAAASSLQRLFYQVRDLGNSDDDQVQFEEVRPDSDSSSNSVRQDGDLEESSSESSDCVLEDLDEVPTEQYRVFIVIILLTKLLEMVVTFKKIWKICNNCRIAYHIRCTFCLSCRTTAGASTEKESAANESKASFPAAKKPPKKKHETPKVILKPKPRYNWTGPQEMISREMGYRSPKQPQAAQIFRSNFYGSLYSVERLELMQKLDGHHGCVNCLNFNYAGTKLASGSDDLFIKIWNFGLGKSLASFHSGHRANVFQAKFLPLVGLDTMIVSCARDNQVRLSELNTAGQVWCSRKLAQHRGPAHKLSVSPESPHVVLSCGEDAVVYSIDIREDKAQRILYVRDRSKKVSLYSIHQNPLCGHEFCVTGRDEFVRIYDTRRLSTATVPVPRNHEDARDVSDNDSTPLKKFCPHHLIDSRHKPNVTAAVYSYNGREIVATYNDENIYLFNATHSDGADCIKVYEGHRNSATIKGVNFFGDKSQFIVSGSDCGHIFLWEKETESIINFLRGDENGVVNCLEPHPTSPILATSGLDDDVKIWIPSKERDPQMGPNNLDLSSTVHKNLKSRQEELERQPESMDGRIIQALWNHIRQANRERRREVGLQLSDSEDSIVMDDDDDDDDDSPARGVECLIS